MPFELHCLPETVERGLERAPPPAGPPTEPLPLLCPEERLLCLEVLVLECSFFKVSSESWFSELWDCMLWSSGAPLGLTEM